MIKNNKKPPDSQTIRVTVLGSGTCVPTLHRSASSVLMEIAGRKLLFDSGPGTMRRLLEAGVTIDQITHFFFSHLHPDHTSELVPFLFAVKYAGFPQPRQPLTILSGKGFSHFFHQLKAAYGEWIELPDRIFRIFELDTESKDHARFAKFSVDSIPVAHNPESIAFKITGPSRQTVVYSGDTDETPNLVQLATDTDLLICESATPDELKIPGHLTPSIAGKIAAESRTRQLLLTHFYPACEKVDIAKQCRKTYSGDLLLAEDLMTIEVP